MEAADNSRDTVWFVEIVKSKCEMDVYLIDDYGHTAKAGMKFVVRHFLELQYTTKKYHVYNVSKKNTFMYKESVLYPFVNVSVTKIGIVIANEEFTEIFSYIQINGFSPLLIYFSNMVGS